jgi:guanylate kinase
VGKDTLLDRLKEQPHPFHFIVTATTRARRPNEVHGRDYFFIEQDEFERMRDADELLEHALVYGQYKGIPKQQVRDALRRGKDVVMRVDVQGAATVRRIVPQALLIFLAAENEDALFRRLRARRTDSDEQIERRMATAREEHQRIDEFDYVVINRENRMDDTVADVMRIIRAEHLRVHPRKVEL